VKDAFRLEELEASFLRILKKRNHRSTSPRITIARAHGVWFLCPLCYAKNKGPVGTHAVICWFAGSGVPDDMDPKPGRWNPAGTGLSDLTFVGPGSTSVLLLSGCKWHGWVQHGEATLHT
jgi:hypothetical protein